MSLDFESLTGRGLPADHEHPAETWEGQRQERAEGATPKGCMIYGSSGLTYTKAQPTKIMPPPALAAKHKNVSYNS